MGRTVLLICRVNHFGKGRPIVCLLMYFEDYRGLRADNAGDGGQFVVEQAHQILATGDDNHG